MDGRPVNGMEDGVIPGISVNKVFFHTGVGGGFEKSITDLASYAFSSNLKRHVDGQGIIFQ
jgi:hypothetical protein